MAKRNNIGKQTLRTPVRVTNDREVYIGDTTVDIDNILCERKKTNYARFMLDC
jgi:hypothetical protein